MGILPMSLPSTPVGRVTRIALTLPSHLRRVFYHPFFPERPRILRLRERNARKFMLIFIRRVEYVPSNSTGQECQRKRLLPAAREHGEGPSSSIVSKHRRATTTRNVPCGENATAHRTTPARANRSDKEAEMDARTGTQRAPKGQSAAAVNARRVLPSEAGASSEARAQADAVPQWSLAPRPGWPSVERQPFDRRPSRTRRYLILVPRPRLHDPVYTTPFTPAPVCATLIFLPQIFLPVRPASQHRKRDKGMGTKESDSPARILLPPFSCRPFTSGDGSGQDGKTDTGPGAR